MASFTDRISNDLARWIAAQPMFFVASAPLSADGHVNVSPKGLDTFRVIDERTVAYVDLTGSGAETSAHLRENGRITIMFAAFDNPPRILRLFGRGALHTVGTAGFERRSELFPQHTGVRSVIEVAVQRVQTSCGFGVPLMGFEGQRDRLAEWAEKKGIDSLPDYWASKNATSIDGLPAYPSSG